jgi:prephenate dehydrogenase
VGERGDLLVIGTGLIGTSVALAARRAGYQVWLDDRAPERLSMAVSMGAGRPWDRRDGSPDGVDLAIVAVSPNSVGRVVTETLRSGMATIASHVASVQGQVQLEVETALPHRGDFVGSHPVAGRERPGPHHASAELFDQRPWIVCATPSSSPAAVDAVSALAAACGAVVSAMSASDHDALLARLSHGPQLVASALAGTLVGLPRPEVALAGTGLRDTTRLADSDPELWAEIVSANPAAVAAALGEVVGPLSGLLAALTGGDRDSVAAAVRELVGHGRRGRDLLAGKHGQRAIRWATVSVVVPDEPGALARLLVDAAAAAVNVEDIRVDHSPGQPLGVVELDVAPDRGSLLERELGERGWTATASPPPPD